MNHGEREDPPSKHPEAGFVAPAVALEAGLGGVAIGIGWLIGVAPAQTLRLDSSALGVGLVATLPMLGGFVWFKRSSWAPLQRIHLELEQLIPLILPKASLLNAALISAAAGLGEELFFRGLVQGGLAARFGDGAGLVLGAAAFGLAHPITRAYVVIAAALGAYLGWLWLATGNLLAPAVAHAVYDFVALAMLSRARSS